MRQQNQAWGWRFIDLAELGRNSWRSYVATLLRVILLPLALLALAGAALFFTNAGRLLLGPAAPIMVIAVALGLVIATGLALAWGVARSHRRPWMSLISPDLRLDWRRLAIGAAVQATLVALTLAVSHLMTGQPWPSGSGISLPGLAVVMLLVPFQAASEEMLFRGYLTQALGRLMRDRAKIAVAVGAVFGAAHFFAYGPLTIPYLALLSMIFSLVSLRDERLELVIGAHTANNWVALGAFDALGAAGKGVRIDWEAIAILVLNGALFYGLTRLLVGRFCDRRAMS
jgi:membrane protease YdiL (CAAX protease family)